MTKKKDAFPEFVLDQLRALPGVRSRRMFGGHGVYQDDVFFAIVSDGRLYFRTSDETRAQYEALGMEQFRPTPKQVLKNYYEVPVDILEDDGLLCEWAREAVRAQKQNQAPRGGKKRGGEK